MQKTIVALSVLMLLGVSVEGDGGSPGRRVVIENGGWELVGDLTLPRGAGRFPVVLLLNKAAGDRTAYHSLAAELAARGIASLALDMRGHGESTNLGIFTPGENADRTLIWDSQSDVDAAVRWLRARPEIDGSRVGIVGASYSGEEMAEVGRLAGYEKVYVALSPGSFSDASIEGIDSSGADWLLVVSRDERYLKEIAAETRIRSRSVEVWELSGAEHATDLLGTHDDLAERIAVWIDTRLTGTIGDTAGEGAAWYRGNVHVHTNRSDGLSSPEHVVEWYRSHGYDFLVVTDHNLQVVTDDLVERYARPDEFLLLPGVEVTDHFERRPVHVNGLGVRKAVEPQGGESVSGVIRRDRDEIERAGGLAVLAHPNGVLAAAISADAILGGGISHFEVCCADFLGGSGHDSTDEIWDAVLSTGAVLYGIAADDAHDFGPDSRDKGAAWVMVRSIGLDADSILSAIRRGDFYSTTGVILDEVSSTDRGLCLRIADFGNYGFRTELVGRGGVVLHADESETPCFELSEKEGYVRARIQRSDGARAWVQPVMVGGEE